MYSKQGTLLKQPTMYNQFTQQQNASFSLSKERQKKMEMQFQEQSVLDFVEQFKTNYKAMDVLVSEINTRNCMQFSGTKFSPRKQPSSRLQATMPIRNFASISAIRDRSSSQTTQYGGDSLLNTRRLYQHNDQYYQQYIKGSNHSIIVRRKQHALEQTSYIQYNRKERRTFKDKVRDYMQQLGAEEDELESRRRAEEAAKGGDARPPAEDEGLSVIQKLHLESKRQAKGEGALPQIKNFESGGRKATEGDRGASAVFQGSMDIMNQNKVEEEEKVQAKISNLIKAEKKKIVPNYMKPNQAWLNRDKKGQPSQKELEGITPFTKSRGNFFPSLYEIKQYQKPKKENADLTEDQLNSLQKGSLKQPAAKLFQINREDPFIQDHFKKLCQEKKDINIIRARLTKGKMKAFLSKKYKGKVAEKILSHFDFSVPLDFGEYLGMLEKLMNQQPEKLKRMAFQVLDFNDDKYVCQLDLYSLMKELQFEDSVFIQAYSYDFCKIVAFLDQKGSKKGELDYELKQKMQEIEKRMKQASAAEEKRLDSIPSLSNTPSVRSSDLEDDDEDEEDEDSFEEEQATEPSKKASKQQMSKRSSVYSRHNITTALKRLNTQTSKARSNNSGRSRKSSKSVVTRGSRRKSAQSFFSYSSKPAEDEEEQLHPFDHIFGRQVHKQLKAQKDIVQKMNLAEFKGLQWDYVFPRFVVDLVSYISAFDVEEFLKAKGQREREEEKLQVFKEQIGRRRDRGENVDENKLMEQYNRENLTEAEQDLMYLKNKLGDSLYKKFLRFFRNVCKNPFEEKESELFLNLESIQKKMKNHFGHRCDFIATRLYYFLSDNVNLKRIYLKEFVEKVILLWEGSQREISRFAFRLLDIDNDQILNGLDLLTVQNSIDLESEYGHELLTIIDYYVTTHLMTRQRVNPKHYLHLENYTKLLGGGQSCIIDELKRKILCKAGKYAHHSVFIKVELPEGLAALGERALQRRAAAHIPKRAILQPLGAKDKQAKRVTFAYVPTFREEEDERKQSVAEAMVANQAGGK